MRLTYRNETQLDFITQMYNGLNNDLSSVWIISISAQLLQALCAMLQARDALAVLATL